MAISYKEQLFGVFMRVQKQTIVIWCSIIFGITSYQVSAASPDAWTEHYNEVKQKCMQASICYMPDQQEK